MKQLTNRQGDVLSFILRFTAEHGYPPTRAEISKGFGWASPNAAEEQVKALAKKGHLLLTKRAARGIRVA